MNPPREGGIQHYPSDWGAQCEAKCRKTGERCPHTCDCQVGTTIAGTAQVGPDWFSLHGRPVRLCRGHWLSWHKRAARLLTLPLIDGGHLSPYNKSGYGSVIIRQDRIDFNLESPKVTIPKAWGWTGWRGKVPAGLLERIPQYTPPTHDEPI